MLGLYRVTQTEYEQYIHCIISQAQQKPISDIDPFVATTGTYINNTLVAILREDSHVIYAEYYIKILPSRSLT